MIGRWSLVVGWDILGLDVRAHSKPKLVHFVLALQASGRHGVVNGEEGEYSRNALQDFATARKLDVAAALRVAGTGITEDEPVQVLASDLVLWDPNGGRENGDEARAGGVVS